MKLMIMHDNTWKLTSGTLLSLVIWIWLSKSAKETNLANNIWKFLVIFYSIFIVNFCTSSLLFKCKRHVIMTEIFNCGFARVAPKSAKEIAAQASKREPKESTTRFKIRRLDKNRLVEIRLYIAILLSMIFIFLICWFTYK